MAVTLYRCSRCAGVFNSVWDTPAGRLCRDCKLQSLGYQPQGATPAAEQVKIIGDVEDTKLVNVCNVIDRNDGFNLAVVKSKGLWVGDNLNLACNDPAVAMGIWHPGPANRPLTTVWACAKHVVPLRDLTELPGRDWFEEKNMGGLGGGKQGQSAIGGQADDPQNLFQNLLGGLGGMGVGQQNAANDIAFQAQTAQFQYSVPDNPKYNFKFTELTAETNAQKAYDPMTDTFYVMQVDGTRVHYSGNGQIIAVVPPGGSFTVQKPNFAAPSIGRKAEPESSPHDAILKPSRKLKFAAE